MRIQAFILSVGFIFLFEMALCFVGSDEVNIRSHQFQDESPLVVLSQQLLEAVRLKNETKELIQRLENTSYEQIVDQLRSDEEKLAFWINIYNAFIQISLQDAPQEYDNRSRFFDKKRINIGGRVLSFSNIEHGIIRRSQWVYGLGRIRNPFAPKYHKDWGPSHKEPRIHFALNCGAKSCPPVAIYSPENLDDELNYMSELFLKANTKIISQSRIETTVLFSWFRGDFGGKKGIKRMLKEYDVIQSERVSLSFGDYDWSLYLDNFVEI